VSNTSLAALVGVGFFAFLLLGGLSWFVGTDSARLTGAGIGALLGVLNLAVGIPLTMRAMRSGTNALLRVIVGGFLINLIAVVVLTVVLHGREGVSEIAFALTYVAFFFIFDGLKVFMVEKSLRRTA